MKTYAQNFRNDEFLIPPAPIRLTEEQSKAITRDMIESCDFRSVVSKKEIRALRRRVYKDWYYRFETQFIRRHGYKPKVRGGLLGISKEVLLRVDGYDENYQGWGMEDDDLGRRLYRLGIRGKNMFLKEYSLHLYHPDNKFANESVNLDYYRQRLAEIRKGSYKAVHGLSNPLGDEEVQVVQIK